MKTEIIKQTETETEIDWSKPMLVVHDSGLVVLTTGQHTEDCFSGQVQVSNVYYTIGFYSTTWTRSKFTPVTEIIEIKYTP